MPPKREAAEHHMGLRPIPVRDCALLSAGSELRVTQNVTLGPKLDSQLAAHSQTYAGAGTIRMTW